LLEITEPGLDARTRNRLAQSARIQLASTASNTHCPLYSSSLDSPLQPAATKKQALTERATALVSRPPPRVDSVVLVISIAVNRNSSTPSRKIMGNRTGSSGPGFH